VKIAIALHGGTNDFDVAVHRISVHKEQDQTTDGSTEWITDHLIWELSEYRKNHSCKILAAGITAVLHEKAPTVCSRLWLELDVVPIVLNSDKLDEFKCFLNMPPEVDEPAKSAAKESMLYVKPRCQVPWSFS
jgi:alpha,alpha-trehalose phosphorylase (configuration-retaining)